MFLELYVYVYFSFDLSGTTGFKFNSMITRKSVDCVACCVCHSSAGVCLQNNFFPASLLFAGTF